MWNYDEQLIFEIEKLRNGDYSSYQSFYNLTANYLYKLVCDIISEKEIADSILNDVYTRIYNEISNISSPYDFYRWAGGIATDLICVSLVSQGQAGMDRIMPESIVYENIKEDGEAIVSESIMCDEEAKRLFADELDKLPLVEKVILQYYYYEGIGIREISARTGLSELMIRDMVADIKDKLKVFVKGYPYAEGSKFYSLAEVPFLLGVFAYTLYETTGMSIIGTGLVGGMAVGAGISAGGAQAVGAGVGAGVAGTSVGTAGTAAVGAGMGAKIAIGVAAVALVAGGAAGIHHLTTEDKDEIQTEITSENNVEEDATDNVSENISEAELEVDDEIRANPTMDMYYFETCSESGEDVYLDYTIAYFNMPGTTYPELKSSFDVWKAEMLTKYYTNVEEYKSCEPYAGMRNSYDVTFSYDRADERVLSVVWGEYSYLGGAHGYGMAEATNFDVQTGRILTLDDIGDVKNDIKSGITNYLITADYLNGGLFDDWETTVDRQIADNSLDWRFTYDGILVSFDQYEIAPYAAGPISIDIPYSQLPGFKAEYLPTGDVYCDTIGYEDEYVDYSVKYDIDNDGQIETISLESEYYSESSSSQNYLLIDGARVTEGLSGMYVNKATFVADKEGKNFAVMEIFTGENYSDYYIYELSSGAAVEVDRFSDLQGLMISPYYIIRRTQINVFGSYVGYKIYVLKSEGLTTEYYSYVLEQGSEPLSLTAKMEFDCKFEENGKLIDGNVSAGTVIHPVECDTDNQEFIFTLDDGRRGRIQYEQSGSSITVNGVSETDLF